MRIGGRHTSPPFESVVNMIRRGGELEMDGRG